MNPVILTVNKILSFHVVEYFPPADFAQGKKIVIIGTSFIGMFTEWCHVFFSSHAFRL